MELKDKFLKYFGQIPALYTIVNWVIWFTVFFIGLVANGATVLDTALYLGLLPFFLLLIWPKGFDYRKRHWRIRLLLAVLGAIGIFVFVVVTPRPKPTLASAAVMFYLIFQICGLSALAYIYRVFEGPMNPPSEDLSLIPLLPLSPFRFQWLLATSLGVGIGFVAAVFGLGTGIPLFFSIGGLFLGFSQWLVLRSKLKNSGLWILATFCAWAVVDILLWLGYIMPLQDIVLTIALASVILFQAFAGFLIGSAQWIILRKQFHDSQKWILYNTTAWLIGAGISFLGLVIINGGLGMEIWYPIVFGIIISTFHGIPYGLITGISMERILENPILDQENLNIEKSSI